MKFRNVFLAGAALVLSSGFLTACVVVDEGPGYRPPPPRPRPPAQACTMEYRPVCGVRGSDSRTFANSCQARSSNYRISHEGACRSSGNRPGPSQPGTNRPGMNNPGWGQQPGSRPSQPGTNRPGMNNPGWGQQPGSRPSQRPNNRPTQACTREYVPVCASSRGQLRTFPNSCEAQSANWRIVSSGPCR